MTAPSRQVKDGVRRRRREDVPATLTTPISICRPVRDHGQFIVDAIIDADREIAEMQRRAHDFKR